MTGSYTKIDFSKTLLDERMMKQRAGSRRGKQKSRFARASRFNPARNSSLCQHEGGHSWPQRQPSTTSHGQHEVGGRKQIP